MDPQLQQLLMALGQQRMQTGTVPNNPVYPPVGQSLTPQPQMMAQPMVPAPAMGAGATTTALDEQGNPLPTYGRGEPAFGNASVGGGAPPADTGKAEAGGAPPAGGAPGGGLAGALRGIVQPRPPDVVKPSTPHLPPLRPIEGGQLIQLMASLGVGPKDIPGLKQSIGR